MRGDRAVPGCHAPEPTSACDRAVGRSVSLWFTRAVSVQFAIMMPINAVRPMVSYRALELGASPLELGVVAAGYGAIAFLLAVPLGRWVDRWGESRFMALGALVASVSVAFMVPVGSIWSLTAVYAVLGVAQATTMIGMQALTANAGRTDRRDARFGVASVSAATSQMVGPPLGGLVYVLSDGSLDWVFVAVVPLMIVAVAVALTLVVWPAPDNDRDSDDHGRSGTAQESMHGAVSTVLRRPSVPHAMLACIAVVATTDLITAYLPAYGEANGIPVEVISLLLGLRAAAAIASRLGLVVLVDRFGRRSVLVVSLVAATGGLALLPTTVTPVSLALLLVVAGCGLGFGQPLSLAWISEAVPPRMRGTALGVRMTGNRVGQMTVPLVAGAIAGVTGVGAVFAVTAVLLGSAAAVVARAPSSGSAAT